MIKNTIDFIKKDTVIGITSDFQQKKLRRVVSLLNVNYGIETVVKGANNSYFFLYHWELNKFSVISRSDLVCLDSAELSRTVYAQIRKM